MTYVAYRSIDRRGRGTGLNMVCVYFYAYIHNNEIVMNFSCLNTAPLLVSILFSRLLILNIANLTHIPPCHTSVCLETRKKNGCRDTQVNREQ
jgi:hypothetical protein